jgi:hypothetical protein
MIESYRMGEIVIDGRTYRRDLLIFPDRIDASWWRVRGHELAIADLESVLSDPPEALLVGTGRYGRMAVLPETEQALADRGIQLVAQPTHLACKTFNQMLSSGQRIVAALHLTC